MLNRFDDRSRPNATVHSQFIRFKWENTSVPKNPRLPTGGGRREFNYLSSRSYILRILRRRFTRLVSNTLDDSRILDTSMNMSSTVDSYWTWQ